MLRWPLSFQWLLNQWFRITKQPIINSNRWRVDIAIDYNLKVKNRGKDHGNSRSKASFLQTHRTYQIARQENSCSQSYKARRWNDRINCQFSSNKRNESQSIACSDWWNLTLLRQNNR
jgi:hypothetical protein